MRTVIGRDGRFASETPEWVSTSDGSAAYQRLAGKRVKQAQEEIVQLLVSPKTWRARPARSFIP